MLVLVLDTATAAVTAGVVEVTGTVDVRAERVVVNARGHGELLAPNIVAALHDADARPADLDAIVADVGPGPYTGLRVGLVTAAVMGEALGVPTYGVVSLDAVATANPGDGDLLVATDARRREVYWARYDARRHRTTEPDVGAAADLPLDGVTTIAGAGARLYADTLGLPLAAHDFPSVAALGERAADRVRAHAGTETLAPLFLRRPDAVANAVTKPVTHG